MALLPGVTHTNTVRQRQIQERKYTEIKNSLKTMHVPYFWKPLGTEMLDMMFPGVLRANTQAQIHKYCVYTVWVEYSLGSCSLWD